MIVGSVIVHLKKGSLESVRRTGANFVCFPKKRVKIGDFPNATPTSKTWKKLSEGEKDQKRRSVWVGQAHFSKIAQRKQKFIKHVNCVFI